MRSRQLSGPFFAVFIASIISVSAPASAADKIGTYTDWGVDEYEFFGLTKIEVEKKFKGKLCFHAGFERVHFQGGSGLNYLGPTFCLHFKDGKVASVQGIFEGCRDTFYRPLLTSKEAALKFAIAGLSDSKDGRAMWKLGEAKKILAALKQAQ